MLIAEDVQQLASLLRVIAGVQVHPGPVRQGPKPGKFLTEKTGAVVWRARYRDAADKEHSKQFRPKVDAQSWLDEVTASIVTGQYVAPRAGNITFRDDAEGWRASQPYRPSTVEVVRIALTKRVYPIVGDVPLSAFTPDLVQRMVKDLEANFAPSTVEVTYSYVSTVFKALTGRVTHPHVLDLLRVLATQDPSETAKSPQDA